MGFSELNQKRREAEVDGDGSERKSRDRRRRKAPLIETNRWTDRVNETKMEGGGWEEK